MFQRFVHQGHDIICRILELSHVDDHIMAGMLIYVQEQTGPFRKCKEILPKAECSGVYVDFEDGESKVYEYENYNEAWQFGFSF